MTKIFVNRRILNELLKEDLKFSIDEIERGVFVIEWLSPEQYIHKLRSFNCLYRQLRHFFFKKKWYYFHEFSWFFTIFSKIYVNLSFHQFSQNRKNSWKHVKINKTSFMNLHDFYDFNQNNALIARNCKLLKNTLHQVVCVFECICSFGSLFIMLPSLAQMLMMKQIWARRRFSSWFFLSSVVRACRKSV